MLKLGERWARKQGRVCEGGRGCFANVPLLFQLIDVLCWN